MTVGIYKQTAKDIMTKHVATLRSLETVHDALLLMAENRLTALPVVDQDGRCIGVISQADIIDAARDADAEDEENANSRDFAVIIGGGVPLEQITTERVQEIMSESIVTAVPTDPVTEVADKMLTNEIHHVPVIDDQQNLIGIVSTLDILNALRAPVAA